MIHLYNQCLLNMFLMRASVWGYMVLVSMVENLGLAVTEANRKSWLKQGIIKNDAYIP